ncbi:RIC3 acetylcholine receptor chaperone isoform X2 [Amblyomma americanum]
MARGQGRRLHPAPLVAASFRDRRDRAKALILFLLVCLMSISSSFILTEAIKTTQYCVVFFLTILQHKALHEGAFEKKVACSATMLFAFCIADFFMVGMCDHTTNITRLSSRTRSRPVLVFLSTLSTPLLPAVPKMANSDIGVGKSIAVLAIVVGCFTVLWPKVFYPMMQAAFSMSWSAQEGQDGMLPGRGPQSRMDEGLGQARPHSPEYSRGRPFPHPSMRQPPRQAAKTGGTMNLVMPLYTIGVVVFFLYTVLKLVCKKPPPAPDNTSQEPWSRPDPRGTAGLGSPSRTAHTNDASKQGPLGEVEELKRRLAQTEALLQQLLLRQSNAAQSSSSNMSQSINLLVRELSKGHSGHHTPLHEQEGLRHRRHVHQTLEGEPACPCGAPLTKGGCRSGSGGSQADSCSDGTADSGDEMSLPPDRETMAL